MYIKVIEFLTGNKIRIAFITFIGSLLMSVYVLVSKIDDKNEEIARLNGLLAKSNSETIIEIQKCNNDKLNAKLHRENEDLLLLVEKQKQSKEAMLKIVEDNKKEKEIISIELDKFKNKKCLNETVDKEYIKEIGELLK